MNNNYVQKHHLFLQKHVVAIELQDQKCKNERTSKPSYNSHSNNTELELQEASATCAATRIKPLCCKGLQHYSFLLHFPLYKYKGCLQQPLFIFAVRKKEKPTKEK